MMEPISVVQEMMTAFAEATGLLRAEKPPRRYLWTDAFAVCNFLELEHQTGIGSWKQLALQLVDQVHTQLGRHRQDDRRTGWISGLSEEEGRRHPTLGGLRIGKQLNERKSTDPYDDPLEWERDGQYFHYLTKWMHALNRLSRSTNKAVFNAWAVELAKASHAGFVHMAPSGGAGMYWKMSIDLSYPLVPFMGQHDPLDGLITYHQLVATASTFSQNPEPDLSAEIADMEGLCKDRSWATDDSLGIGGLLWDSHRIVQLILEDAFRDTSLLEDLLKSSLVGLELYRDDPLWDLPAHSRLAFRELGMAIGLHAVERTEGLVRKRPDRFPRDHVIHGLIDHCGRYLPLSANIEQFWLDSRNRQSKSWLEHLDINRVMLATSLAPDAYLDL
jgi:hypothetical protein